MQYKTFIYSFRRMIRERKDDGEIAIEVLTVWEADKVDTGTFKCEVSRITLQNCILLRKHPKLGTLPRILEIVSVKAFISSY